MTDNALPQTLWLGKIQGEWPIYTFLSEDSAMTWFAVAKDRANRRKCLWRIDGIDQQAVELDLHIDKPRLVEKS